MRHEGGYIYWIILMSRHDHNNSNCSFLWRRQWHPTPVLLPGTSHGQRSLVGCSPWGREESDTTEQLHFQFSLSCIGEGNGNPLQCSCLENPRDGGAWWAAIFGVTQSRTRLKRLSSSSSFLLEIPCIIPCAKGITWSQPSMKQPQTTIYEKYFHSLNKNAFWMHIVCQVFSLSLLGVKRKLRHGEAVKLGFEPTGFRIC